MNPEPTDAGDKSRQGKPISGRHIRLEDDDADTTIRPSRYRDWKGPMRLQPVKEVPGSTDAEDQECSRSPGVHLRLDDGEEWSVVDQEPAEEAPPPPKTEREQDAP
jgi:hypothetical protein